MATIREYYDTDFKTMMTHADWKSHNKDSNSTSLVRARVHQDFDGNAKYWSFYIPDAQDYLSTIVGLFNLEFLEKCTLTPEGDPIYVEDGFANYSERVNSTTLVFTRRVFFYIDRLLDVQTRQDIARYGLERGLHVVVRDREFAAMRSEFEKPMAFISHDSRDKDEIVRELASELSTLMCPVWYDEYSLKVGDSLREQIEAGLKETRKCILVLSPNFLSNSGWGKAEFDSVYIREILEEKNVILPVWHKVDVKQVYQYSPRLADKVGLSSSIGIKKLAGKLANAIRSPSN